MRLAMRRASYRAPIPRSIVGRVQTSGYYGRFQPAGIEMKFLDTIEGLTIFGTSGTICAPSLNIVPQDDTQSGRTGRKITIRKIQIRGQAYLPNTLVAATTGDTLRMLVVLDQQANGANPTVAQILESADTNAFYNMANSSRFRVLWDKKMVMNATAGGAPTATASFGEVYKNISWFKACNIPIEYDATASTGALTTIRSNNLMVIGVSNEGIAQVGWTCRIRYSDL